MDEELVISMECPCGAVFEPTEFEIDQYGERWCRCPQCETMLQSSVMD